MKTERITVLGSPEFKAFLATEAAKEGVSVSELVRQRCERRPNEDEALLSALAGELERAVKTAKASLREGLAAVKDALAESKMARNGE